MVNNKPVLRWGTTAHHSCWVSIIGTTIPLAAHWVYNDTNVYVDRWKWKPCWTNILHIHVLYVSIYLSYVTFSCNAIWMSIYMLHLLAMLYTCQSIHYMLHLLPMLCRSHIFIICNIYLQCYLDVNSLIICYIYLQCHSTQT